MLASPVEAPPVMFGRTVPPVLLYPLEPVRRMSTPNFNAWRPRVQLNVSAQSYSGVVSPELWFETPWLFTMLMYPLPTPAGLNATGYTVPLGLAPPLMNHSLASD